MTGLAVGIVLRVVLGAALFGWPGALVGAATSFLGLEGLHRGLDRLDRWRDARPYRGIEPYTVHHAADDPWLRRRG